MLAPAPAFRQYVQIPSQRIEFTRAAARAVRRVDCLNLEPSPPTLAANLKYPLTDGAAYALLDDFVPLRHARDGRHPGLASRVGAFVLSTLGANVRWLFPCGRWWSVRRGIASTSGPEARRPARGRASCGVMVLAVSYLSVLISARPMLEREPAAMSWGRL